MFYYHIGTEKKNGKIREVIEKSETEVVGRQPMSEEETVFLLSKYEAQDRISELKNKLSETDYIPCKIAEGSATIADYEEMIAARKAWRAEINRLEQEYV